MQTIGTYGWDVPVKRNLSINENTNIVYVQGKFGLQTDLENYEYSGDAPARLRSIFEDSINGPYGKQNFINLFYCLPEIFAPIHEIASRVADANWQLCREMDDAVDYKDKYFNQLFSQPNPLMSHKQFVYQSVCYELLTGASMQYLNMPPVLEDDYRNIITWTNLPTQKIKFNKLKVDPYSAMSLADFISSYEIEGSRTFVPKNVITIANYDLGSGNAIDGFMSPLLGARLAIKNLLPVYEARGVIYIKRGALGFIVSKKSDESGLVSLTHKEKEDVQKEFQHTYGLTNGKNQVGVTSAPVEFVKTSMSIQELQPFDETLADAVAIYAALRVPRHLVPSKDSSTFANADADMKSFYGNVIIPMANRFAQTWSNRFKIPNRYIKANFSHIAEVQENKKDRANAEQIYGNIWLQRWTSGVCCLNDWLKGNDATPVIGNSLYEKKLFEMAPEELAIVQSVINLKAASTGTPSKTGGVEKPAIV